MGDTGGPDGPVLLPACRGYPKTPTPFFASTGSVWLLGNRAPRICTPPFSRLTAVIGYVFERHVPGGPSDSG
jgi:hypothetical protein